jgi:hypothetical protein
MMDWRRLWIPTPEDFRLMQMLTSLLMAAVIGVRLFPPLRPYARPISLVALAAFVAGVLGLVIWHALLG